MSETALRILTLAISASPPGALIETAATWAEVARRLAVDGPFDAVLVDGDAAPATAAEVSAVVAAAPLVVVVLEPDAETACDWLRQGADDVVGRDELAGGRAWRRVRFAVERRRRAAPQRSAHSTDTATGLPHRQQLVEHLSQLLALREREPAPMAVVALRVTLLAGDGETAGAVIAPTPAAADRDLVRRKVAVRLRAGVRASDVVAAVADDVFAVLLGSVVSSADAERVAAKLVASLGTPFTAAGRRRAVSVAIGVAHFPGDGRDAERLLGRALALALAAPGVVASGSAASHDASGALRSAANDDR